jgi:hypothetical protein
LKAGRKRLSATFSALVFPARYAENHVLKVVESKLRVSIASRAARFASVRAADAVASLMEDSVPHFADAKPV